MQKRCIGDIWVSRIGLGTTKFGRNQAVNYPLPFKLPSISELKNLLALARDLGINLIDTAPAYGSSEERIGELLQDQRNDWVICTKAGEEFRDGESHFDFSPAAITKSVERSLQRLKTDFIDFLLIHSNGDDEKIIDDYGVFDTLSRLKQQGKVRYYGMSTKTVGGGERTVREADLAMVTYNPSYRDEESVIKLAHQKNKGIFIKKAFNSGRLSPDISMPFLYEQAGVSSVIVGTITPPHLQYNVEKFA